MDSSAPYRTGLGYFLAISPRSPSILCNVDPEKYLAIIAEEVGISRDELHDDTEFADLGLDRVLAQAIADRFADETSQRLEVSVFESCPDVRSFMRRLDKTVAESTVPEKGTVHVPIEKMMMKKKKKNAARTSPLVLPLQGNPATAKKTLFLLPDGSGSGLAYARIPPLGPDICLCALNSPFLGAGPFSTTIEEMSATFTAAIREAQPHGPYNLGGWSAGGYFATEVARSLLRAGEAVERVLLIDSPCRVEYEAMPIEVVRFLAPRNLMGNWGDKKAGTPQWLVDHFEGTLAAVAEYEPGPIIEGRVANVFVVEASQAVFGTQAELVGSGLDLGVRLTRDLLGPRSRQFDPHGWHTLYPGARLRWARTSGSHFTLVHPPHVSFVLPSPSCFSNFLDNGETKAIDVF
ncbi:hypothetical protein PG996_013027 [Apiospora saccharicola]|uniref:Carrier domain-containing protein n=1 Tax=Apiospora saccharicola TaxID=335842 RepID=A0ABR1U4A9_9PEZI